MSTNPNIPEPWTQISALPPLKPEEQKKVLREFYALQMEACNYLVRLGYPLARSTLGTIQRSVTGRHPNPLIRDAQKSTNGRKAQFTQKEFKTLAACIHQAILFNRDKDWGAAEKAMKPALKIVQNLDYSRIRQFANAATPINSEWGTPEDLTPIVQSLKRSIRKADELREKLLSHNVRFALYIASARLAETNLADDVIQEALLGLLTAIDKYNPKSEAKLTTFAAFWIRQKIGRFILNHGRNVRIPVHRHDLMRSVLIRKRKLEDLGFSESECVAEIAHSMDLTEDEVLSILEGLPSEISFEKDILNPDSDRSLHEKIPDTLVDHNSVAEQADNRDLHAKIIESFEILTPQERMVLSAKFGTGDLRKSATNVIRDELYSLFFKALDIEIHPHKEGTKTTVNLFV